MISIADHPRTDPPSPLPFPVNLAREVQTPAQRHPLGAQEWDRSLRTLAARLGCLGWFDPRDDSPRAA